VTGLLAAALAAVALGGHGGAAGRPHGPWILLTSNRDGQTRGYSVRPDGSRLTPLLPRARRLVPAAVSRDGSTVAYEGGSGIYVSRADGSRLHRVVGEAAWSAALSSDGKLLACTIPTRGRGIWIVGADGRRVRRLTRGLDSAPAWSPDGTSVVFVRRVGSSQALVVQPLHGSERWLAWGAFSGRSAWSPDGRWIAYIYYAAGWELFLTRPNGTGRHSVTGNKTGWVGAFDWSPDGKRLAVADGGIAITGVAGRVRRLGVGVSGFSVRWLPDARRLALADADGQIWIVDRAGHGLRRVTREGSNDLVGWTRLAPARPPATPLPKTERVLGRETLALRAQVTGLAADGARVAFVTQATAFDCDHVAVWTPAARSLRRPLPAPCEEEPRDVPGSVALAGTRVAWSSAICITGTLDNEVLTAQLSRLDRSVGPVAAATLDLFDGDGASIGGPVGDGTLLAFTVRVYRGPPLDEVDACPPSYETGDASSTTLWRLGGHGLCPGGYGAHECAVVLKGEGKLELLAVDAGRIVVGTQNGVEIVSAVGRVLGRVAATPTAAALSASLLAVQTAAGIDVYDADSGRLVVRLPGLKGLQDLEGGILVSASGGTVTLRRLADGRTTSFQVDGKARAQLERPGLFLAGARRVTFTPMRKLFP
jgi:Tol biopolymer transport system component